MEPVGGPSGGVSWRSASLGVFLIFKGRVSGYADKKGVGDGDRCALRGPTGRVAI